MFPSNVEWWFDWHLTNRCNFYCDYCHPQIRYVLNRRNLDEPDPETCAEAFNSTGRVCGVLMSGGEPFAFPSFIRLSSLLTDQHYIALNTNLSMADEIQSFATHIPPARVASVLAAVHIAERESRGYGIAEFACNYRILRDAGFRITAAYVLHPALLDRAPDDFSRLRDAGVDRLIGKVFKGTWQHRRYPADYDSAEGETVATLASAYHVGDAYLDRDWDFRDRPCQSGMQSFKVSVTGDVQRCVSVPDRLGNLFDGTFEAHSAPEPCTARRILVLSECAAHLVARPPDLERLLKPRS